jgi:TRAP-type C4-dicarboxylate transport system substrate-binding protein
MIVTMMMATVRPAVADVSLVFASFAAKENIFNQTALHYMQEVKQRTNGFISIKDEFYSGALLKGGEMIKGVGRGLADVGFYCVGYTPADLPLTSMTEMPYITEKGDAAAEAMTELYASYPPLRQEYDRLNVEVLGFLSPSSTIIGVKRKVTSAGDLKGLKVRAYGQVGEILQKGGDMAPVSIAFGDIYQSLQTGLIDGYAGIPLWLPPTENWYPLTTTVVDPGIGTYFSCGIAMNKDQYKALPQRIQEIMVKMRSEFPKLSMRKVLDGNVNSVAAAQKANVGFYQFTKAEADAWRMRVDVPAMEQRWISERKDKTNANVAEFWAKYKALVRKNEPKSIYRVDFPIK